MKGATAATAKQRWEREVLEPALAKAPERDVPFTTISGRPIDRLYTPDDVSGLDYQRDLNNPGQFPYTRGIHPTGYRGKLWTMRQFAGFGTPEETNQRYKALLAAARSPTPRGEKPRDSWNLGVLSRTSGFRRTSRS